MTAKELYNKSRSYRRDQQSTQKRIRLELPYKADNWVARNKSRIYGECEDAAVLGNTDMIYSKLTTCRVSKHVLKALRQEFGPRGIRVYRAWNRFGLRGEYQFFWGWLDPIRMAWLYGWLLLAVCAEIAWCVL